MNIIQHVFNGNIINQLLEDTLIGKNIVPRGYVNATAMCKANKKKWSNYSVNKNTIAYINALSGSAGIPADQLIFENESEGSNEERGTWVHVEVAIHLSIWLSPEFAVWAVKTLRHVIEGNFAALTDEATEAQQNLINVWNKIRIGGKVTPMLTTN